MNETLQCFLEIVAFGEERTQLVAGLCDGVAGPQPLALIHGNVRLVVAASRQRGVVVVVAVDQCLQSIPPQEFGGVIVDRLTPPHGLCQPLQLAPGDVDLELVVGIGAELLGTASFHVCSVLGEKPVAFERRLWE